MLAVLAEVAKLKREQGEEEDEFTWRKRSYF